MIVNEIYICMTYNLVALYFVIVSLVYQMVFISDCLEIIILSLIKQFFFLVFTSSVQLENRTAERYQSDSPWELKTSLFWRGTIFLKSLRTFSEEYSKCSVSICPLYSVTCLWGKMSAQRGFVYWFIFFERKCSFWNSNYFFFKAFGLSTSISTAKLWGDGSLDIINIYCSFICC